MIKVILKGHDYQYEVKELLKLFYKNNEIHINKQNSYENQENILISELLESEHEIIITTIRKYNGNIENIQLKQTKQNDDQLKVKKKSKELIKKGIFLILNKTTKKTPPWGILTGIRPTKIAHELLSKSVKEDQILSILTQDYCIQNDKALLLLEIAKREYKYIYPIDDDKVSIYISIPFCPSKCIYCSFPSNPLNRWSNLIEKYIDALSIEIVETSKMLNQMGKKVDTIYIGGGTPTSLDEKQLEKLINVINASFENSTLREFTVEAGRPDTITKEKLQILIRNNVNRISINPQSMNEETLLRIGRNHNVKQIIDTYYLAKEIGFININMDIIIGLPGENATMVEKTMEQLQKLDPASITVHTLAVKKASRLNEQSYAHDLAIEEVFKSLEITQQFAKQMGLKPYYLYRQKHMAGNLENIGYSKPNLECIYNIQIMEEKQSIIAMGAGGISKIVFPSENRLERVPNIKDLQLYIERINEMIDRKKKIFNEH